MQQIEKTGRTVEEALAVALEELGAERDEVDVEVLAESGRGILGIFGQTEARIKVTRRPSVGAKAAELTGEMLSLLNIQARVDVRREDAESAELEINAGEDTGLIIGRRGETLGALQYLVALVVNRGQPIRKRILLNAGGYLERREQALHALARRTAQKVRSSGRPVTLEALSPRERRIVHLALADEPGLTTS
ncbi:MAG: KH domain-containing protein, partial [Armatimonadetes bacterium]|nr:KH domain-containing protein [Armatimonadota bacterium]NIM24299.1 KH domain-containing protein [Armatimonadota bacterium]NIM68168.1 KH domain-containing protein [Armatimonadota bacterium]NIM76628.1 KH domain-containing protein [Armatimonadota bacterium]NIN06373.1 KH domain-containing protein [Armatimonadota bacterium]